MYMSQDMYMSMYQFLLDSIDVHDHAHDDVTDLVVHRLNIHTQSARMYLSVLILSRYVFIGRKSVVPLFVNVIRMANPFHDSHEYKAEIALIDACNAMHYLTCKLEFPPI